MRAISAARASFRSAEEIRLPKRPSAMLAVTRRAVSTPMSDWINSSSKLSSMASSSTRLFSSRPSKRPKRPGFSAGAAASSGGPATKSSSPAPILSEERNILSRSFLKNDMRGAFCLSSPKPHSVWMQAAAPLAAGPAPHPGVVRQRARVRTESLGWVWDHWFWVF